MRGFHYLGDRVKASGSCEAAVTARARICGGSSSNVESC